MTVLYSCDKCLKSFTKKSIYDYHVRRKISCDMKNDEITCDNCNKHFSTYSNLCKHKRYICNEMILELKKSRKNKDKIIIDLYQKINTIANNKDKNIIINTNITNNNNNNIQIIAFDILQNSEFLQFSDYGKLFNKCMRCIQAYIEYVYCNPNRPEYNNIYISNIVNKFIKIHDGKNWHIENKDVVIDELIRNVRDILEDAFEEYKEQLNIDTINRFNKFIDINKDKNSKKYKKFIEHVTNEVILIFYNYRNNIKKNKKMLSITDVNIDVLD